MEKKRNPIIFWLIAIFTGGLFGFIWTYLMASNSNALAGEERIKIKKNVIITVGLFAVYLVLFAFNLLEFEKNFEIAQAGETPDMPGAAFFLNFFIGLVMMGHLVSVLLRIANIARTKVDVPNSAVLVVLTLIYMITLPILQSKLNKIDHNQSLLDNA